MEIKNSFYYFFIKIYFLFFSSNFSELCNLPIEWIDNGIKMVEENTLDRNKLCLTRRSGGLPFYLQSILTDEPIQQRGQQRTYLAKLMDTLLNIIQNDPDTLQIDGQILENSRKVFLITSRILIIFEFLNRFMHIIQFVHFIVIKDLAMMFYHLLNVVFIYQSVVLHHQYG